MRLKNIKAIPRPDGNQIDLSWEFDPPAERGRVRVVRRADTFPIDPGDGHGVNEGDGLCIARDTGLQAETIYYYALFDSNGTLLGQAAAMATGRYDMAEQLYSLLPAIYRRYDAQPAGMASQERGPLRRFLDLPGGQLDQLYSLARALLCLYDLDRVNGRLLPLLAAWIGWHLDFRRQVAGQRNELRYAPSIQEAMGGIPALEAAVKRLTGWECRTKEFANNIFRANEPERLNLWARRRCGDAWSVPTEPLSLDFAYEGRPVVVRRDEAGGRTRLWLFYQTRPEGSAAGSASGQPRQATWAIWYKTALSFRLRAAEFKHWLEERIVSPELQDKFKEHDLSLSLNIAIAGPTSGDEQPGSSCVWHILDRQSGNDYVVREDHADLVISAGWSPSQPLTHGPQLDTHPAAVLWNGMPWVFWESYNEAKRQWQIDFCFLRDTGRSEIATLVADRNLTSSAICIGSDEPERRMPCAVVDGTGCLWLFWFESAGAGWQLRYNVYDKQGEPQFNPPQRFMVATPPDLFGSPFALFYNEQIWLFWAQPTDQQSQRRQRIMCSAARPDAPASIKWSEPAQVQLDTPEDAADGEPAALVNRTGNMELFWSSNRDGSWSIWRSERDEANTWGVAQPLTDPPYSQRAPFPVEDGLDTLLIYRSSESLAYTSLVYSVTRTLDTRYAGCTTVDTRNRARLARRAQFADFQAYTCDVGRTNADWYVRDTVGLYLTPNTDDPVLIARYRNLIEYISREYVPVQVRVVFIIEPPIYREKVYTYDFPDDRPVIYIDEHYVDQLRCVDQYAGVQEVCRDVVPDWIWVRAWSAAYPDHTTVDFRATPIVTRYRTWQTWVSNPLEQK